MLQPGDMLENPVTGERGVVRSNSATQGEYDLFVQPGGALVGEHVHPALDERFTLLTGRLDYRLDGREGVAVPGETIEIPAGAAHDWWNAGDEDVHVRVRMSGTVERFELAIGTLWGLARDGKTDPKGRPSLLQAALIAQEFDDVIVFTRPPRIVQRVVFGLLAPLARRRGHAGVYDYGPPARAEVPAAGA